MNIIDYFYNHIENVPNLNIIILKFIEKNLKLLIHYLYFIAPL